MSGCFPHKNIFKNGRGVKMLAALKFQKAGKRISRDASFAGSV